MNFLKRTSADAPVYYVIHPLDDAPETKRDVSDLGPMKMTRSVKWSLYVLQAYLFLMAGMVVFRALELANVIR